MYTNVVRTLAPPQATQARETNVHIFGNGSMTNIHEQIEAAGMSYDTCLTSQERAPAEELTKIKRARGHSDQ